MKAWLRTPLMPVVGVVLLFPVCCSIAATWPIWMHAPCCSACWGGRLRCTSAQGCSHMYVCVVRETPFFLGLCVYLCSYVHRTHCLFMHMPHVYTFYTHSIHNSSHPWPHQTPTHNHTGCSTSSRQCKDPHACWECVGTCPHTAWV